MNTKNNKYDVKIINSQKNNHHKLYYIFSCIMIFEEPIFFCLIFLIFFKHFIF